jgi:hypothetical protein
MQKFITNWKTTLTGLATVITGVVKIASGDVVGGATLLLTGLGLVHAKDA